jgi:hypothetical protein
MSKQTAVEWLLQQIENKNGKEFSSYYQEFVEQALQMEKEQIINAFGVGCHHESKRLVGYQDTAEQYYNETYGNSK